MDTDKIVRGGGPENTAYDRMRHESMKLKPMGMYGIPKSFLDSSKMTCCEKCVFDTGVHTCETSQ